jgi:cbb3-type cytochrome oxidase subunit 3
MLKFIKHHMSGILGIEIYPIIGFVLFFGFFLLMLWWVFTTERRHFSRMEQMPFSDNDLTGPGHGQHLS